MSIRFLSPAQAATELDAGAVPVDLRPHEAFVAGHVPGAVHLRGALLSRKSAAVGGLLPRPGHLGRILGDLGLTPTRPVLAYDDEGAPSGRLLWVLDVLGHRAELAILDGSFGAWRDAGMSGRTGATHREPAIYPATLGEEGVADSHYILQRLGSPDMVVLDVRSPAEFRGEDVRSARGGHVPGAVNLDWRQVMDLERHRQLLAPQRIRAQLESLGVTPQKEVVVYCQTHQRSSHTYAVLKHLGYERVRGYPGAWSDWGNDLSLPVESGA